MKWVDVWRRDLNRTCRCSSSCLSLDAGVLLTGSSVSTSSSSATASSSSVTATSITARGRTSAPVYSPFNLSSASRITRILSASHGSTLPCPRDVIFALAFSLFGSVERNGSVSGGRERSVACHCGPWAWRMEVGMSRRWSGDEGEE